MLGCWDVARAGAAGSVLGCQGHERDVRDGLAVGRFPGRGLAVTRTVEAERLAALLRLLKERSGRSFEALAMRTGVSGSSLHRYCAGDKIPSNYGVVESFAKVCGASQQELSDLHRLWLLAEASQQQTNRQPSSRQQTAQLPELPGRRHPLARRLRDNAPWLGAAVVAIVIAGVLAWWAVADRSPAADRRVLVGQGVLLANVRTGMCADVPGTGAGALDGPVQQHGCVSGAEDNQMWVLVPSPTGDGTVAVQNLKDRLCLDVPFYADVAPGTPVQQFGCRYDAGDNQMFRPERTGPGDAFLLRHVKTPGLCLDVAGQNGSGPEDARLTLWPCSTEDDHLWVTRPT